MNLTKFVLHCVSKNDTDVAHYNVTSTDFGIFWQRCCGKNMLSNGHLVFCLS